MFYWPFDRSMALWIMNEFLKYQKNIYQHFCKHDYQNFVATETFQVIRKLLMMEVKVYEMDIFELQMKE